MSGYINISLLLECWIVAWQGAQSTPIFSGSNYSIKIGVGSILELYNADGRSRLLVTLVFGWTVY